MASGCSAVPARSMTTASEPEAWGTVAGGCSAVPPRSMMRSREAVAWGISPTPAQSPFAAQSPLSAQSPNVAPFTKSNGFGDYNGDVFVCEGGRRVRSGADRIVERQRLGDGEEHGIRHRIRRYGDRVVRDGWVRQGTV